MIVTNCMKTDNSIRINVPKLVRDALGLTRGTKLQFEVISSTECRIRNLDALLAQLANNERAA